MMQTDSNHYDECNSYLSARTGTYEFRCKRYAAVAEALQKIRGDILLASIVVDYGAGRCEFGRYLRNKFPKRGIKYWPLDGSIDGIDLSEKIPNIESGYGVAIEFLEHLPNPEYAFYQICNNSEIGVVITTPNPRTTDVLGMDRTHKTAISKQDLEKWGCEVQETELFGDSRFGNPADTLLGVWRRR
jgi:hypothetical protein